MTQTNMVSNANKAVKGLYHIEAPDLTLSSLPKEITLAGVEFTHAMVANKGVWVRDNYYPLAEVLEWISAELINNPKIKEKLFSQGQPTSIHFTNDWGTGGNETIAEKLGYKNIMRTISSNEHSREPVFLVTVKTPKYEVVQGELANQRKFGRVGVDLAMSDGKGLFYDQRSIDYFNGRFGLFQFVIPHKVFLAYKQPELLQSAEQKGALADKLISKAS